MTFHYLILRKILTVNIEFRQRLFPFFTSWLVEKPPQRTGPRTYDGLMTANSNFSSSGSSFTKSQAAFSARVYNLQGEIAQS